MKLVAALVALAAASAVQGLAMPEAEPQTKHKWCYLPGQGCKRAADASAEVKRHADALAEAMPHFSKRAADASAEVKRSADALAEALADF